MKAVLIFKLPEENCEYRIAANAMEFAITLRDIDEYLRQALKSEHKYYSADAALQAVRDLLKTFMADRYISLDMIE